MPDILALGLGGGSRVQDEGRSVGPQSVGHDLVTRGLAFGGDVLTATDLLVAAGKVEVGTVKPELDAQTVSNGIDSIGKMLNQGVEQMMPSSEPLPVILVGGGAILVSEELEAASSMYIPEHSGVANAIGAAIAQIGGEVERLVSYRDTPREEAIQQISAEAASTAIAAGADASTIRIADIEETTISYMAEGSTRVRIKAVGDIGKTSA